MTSKDLVSEQRAMQVKDLASSFGFEFVGISRAEKLDKQSKQLESWLNKGMHGTMSWMENHFEKRTDPRLLVPGAKSVITLLLNYYTDKKQVDPEAPQISKYAFGEDYHQVLKDKLYLLVEKIRSEIGDIEGRVFVDSAPVMDKVWAEKSGLGWIGKNSNLITKEQGSFFFIAEIISDLELSPDGPIKDYCGNCSRCIDACPTDAIVQPYVVDGSKCISYFTIELKEQIPVSVAGKMDNWMFGCDVCQQVCPWNRFAKQHQESSFQPVDGLLEMTKDDWIELTEDVFKKMFGKSAVKRTKFGGLKRNIHFLNNG